MCYITKINRIWRSAWSFLYWLHLGEISSLCILDLWLLRRWRAPLPRWSPNGSTESSHTWRKGVRLTKNVFAWKMWPGHVWHWQYRFCRNLLSCVKWISGPLIVHLLSMTYIHGQEVLRFISHRPSFRKWRDSMAETHVRRKPKRTSFQHIRTYAGTHDKYDPCKYIVSMCMYLLREQSWMGKQSEVFGLCVNKFIVHLFPYFLEGG